MDGADRGHLLRTLVATLLADDALTWAGWEQLVLVSVHEAGTCDMTGFRYSGDGRATPVSPSDFGVFDVLDELRAAMAAEDGGAPWLAALFRLERATARVTAEFEYEHPERWQVTPATVGDRAREFAPS